MDTLLYALTFLGLFLIVRYIGDKILEKIKERKWKQKKKWLEKK